MKWYRKAAEQGYADAQFNISKMYYKGDGVSQDYAEAAKWYRKAAEQGHDWAQYNLGWMYFCGEGVPKDYAEAVKHRDPVDAILIDASLMESLEWFGKGPR